MEKKVLYVVLILVAAAVAVAIYLEKDAIAAAVGGSSSGSSGSSGSGGSSGACAYPVDSTSSTACLMQAFKDSGYWGQLNSTQQASASSDPSTWLQAHPYLYTVFPEYFTLA